MLLNAYFVQLKRIGSFINRCLLGLISSFRSGIRENKTLRFGNLLNLNIVKSDPITFWRQRQRQLTHSLKDGAVDWNVPPVNSAMRLQAAKDSDEKEERRCSFPEWRTRQRIKSQLIILLSSPYFRCK